MKYWCVDVLVSGYVVIPSETGEDLDAKIRRIPKRTLLENMRPAFAEREHAEEVSPRMLERIRAGKIRITDVKRRTRNVPVEEFRLPKAMAEAGRRGRH